MMLMVTMVLLEKVNMLDAHITRKAYRKMSIVILNNVYVTGRNSPTASGTLGIYQPLNWTWLSG